jgi:hypothetical protein
MDGTKPDQFAAFAAVELYPRPGSLRPPNIMGEFFTITFLG